MNWLNTHEVKAILNEMAVRCPDWAELTVLTSQQDEEEEQVWVSAAWALKEEMHVIDWLEAQNKDPVIQKAIEWMQSGKARSLKYHLGDLASTSEGLGFISR